MVAKRHLAISCGDPGGVGPAIALQAVRARPDTDFTLFGDARQLQRLCLNRPSVDAALPPTSSLPNNLSIVDVSGADAQEVYPPLANAESGRLQLRALEQAARYVAEGQAAALVTAPTSKYAIQLSGVAFTGQTEYLAALSELDEDAVTMLFLGPILCVGLVTTHVATQAVSALLTQQKVTRTLGHLHAALQMLQRPGPMVVAGLNPHAGERGAFGREEIDIISPAVAAFAAVNPQAVFGTEAIGAETAFRFALERKVAGVVAMTHDQATIAAKLLDWSKSVNVTWGLPFVRTSPDHGVAYDAARSGIVDAAGMLAAVDRAVSLVG